MDPCFNYLTPLLLLYSSKASYSFFRIYNTTTPTVSIARKMLFHKAKEMSQRSILNTFCMVLRARTPQPFSSVLNNCMWADIPCCTTLLLQDNLLHRHALLHSKIIGGSAIERNLVLILTHIRYIGFEITKAFIFSINKTSCNNISRNAYKITWHLQS